MTLDDWKNWRRRSFNATTEAIGLGRPRPYDLRHSFASLMIRDCNTSIVELAEQLGHSPTETLKTYAHVFAQHRRHPAPPRPRERTHPRCPCTNDRLSASRGETEVERSSEDAALGQCKCVPAVEVSLRPLLCGGG